MMKHAKLNIRALALAGAQVRLGELALERAAILRAFPAILPGMPPPETVAHAIKPRRKLSKRRMTTAQRKAIGVRMRKYWRKRRAATRMRQVTGRS